MAAAAHLRPPPSHQPLQAASTQIKGGDRFPVAPYPFPLAPAAAGALPPSSVARERGGRRAKLPNGPCSFLLLFKSPPSLLHGTMLRAFLSFQLALNTVNSPSQNKGKWNLQIQKTRANMQS